MLRGYCIRRRGDPGPGSGATGVGGRPVRLFESGSLGMWLSDSAAESATLERLREHERVVRLALRTATPLPLRFGTMFRDEQSVVTALGKGEEEFLAALERVAGRAEMGLRVELAAPHTAVDRPDSAPVGPPATPAPDARYAPGLAYLTRRRATLQQQVDTRSRADSILREIEESLTDLKAPAVREPALDAELLGSLAHLVHKGEIQHYRERIARLQEQRRDLRLTVTGPWAPYSFVR